MMYGTHNNDVLVRRILVNTMKRKRYEHSAYWYAYHNGWTYSEAKTYTGKYLDMHTYHPRCRQSTRDRLDDACRGKDWFAVRDAPKRLDSKFNPLLLCACAMVDIGVAVRDTVSKFTNPTKRAALKQSALRRPFYYARETARRRELSAARRKVTKRTTTAPMPKPEDIIAAWNARKDSREAMIRLGGMLQDLECYVDNSLRFDEFGNVSGRNGGIKEWLQEKLPELHSKYKTLMRYKAMAMRLRQATDTQDPKPTSALLDETPRHEVVLAILAEPTPVFSQVFTTLECIISPDTVFLDIGKPRLRGQERERMKTKRPTMQVCNTRGQSISLQQPVNAHKAISRRQNNRQ